jgi:hypothetical protein
MIRNELFAKRLRKRPGDLLHFNTHENLPRVWLALVFRPKPPSACTLLCQPGVRLLFPRAGIVAAVKVSAGRRLGLDIIKHGARTPSLKTLRRRIEAWAASIDTIDPNDPPAKLFEIDDWKIEIVLFGGFQRDTIPDHAIASAMGEGRIVNAETEIREAVSDKGKRYGELDASYVVVVVDCKEELAGADRNADALIDAAFGSVVTQVCTLPDGQQEIKDVRIEDGYRAADVGDSASVVAFSTSGRAGSATHLSLIGWSRVWRFTSDERISPS